MTLTLDEVRNVRFPIAKRVNEGYRATEVDDFVDRVELAFAEFEDERERLTAQVRAFESLNPGQTATETKPEVSQDALAEQLRAELEQAQAQLASAQQELDHRNGELEQVKAELNHTQAQLVADGKMAGDIEQVRSQLGAEASRLGDENAKLRAELEQAKAQVNQLSDELVNAKQNLDQAKAQLDSNRTHNAEAMYNTGYIPVIQDGVERIEVVTHADAGVAVARMVALSTEQAEIVTREANEEAQRILTKANTEAQQVSSDAQSKADQLVGEARIRSERMVSEAQMNVAQTTKEANERAEKVTREAQEYADRLYQETDQRREELFNELQQDRDVYAGKVDRLRNFEASFRADFEKFIASMSSKLGETEFEPADKPVILDKAANANATPRLDALLAEQQRVSE